MQYNHIVLIGFKHVGKTRIGRELAKELNKTFMDLDEEVEKLYKKTHLEASTCRQIMRTHGETYYKELESDALQRVLKSQSSVISLGGFTSFCFARQEIIKPDLLLHVVAPCGVVFERIMIKGRPAFFNPNENPYESFSRLWDEWGTVYRKLTTRIVNNSGTVEQAVKEAITHVHELPL